MSDWQNERKIISEVMNIKRAFEWDKNERSPGTQRKAAGDGEQNYSRAHAERKDMRRGIKCWGNKRKWRNGEM